VIFFKETILVVSLSLSLVELSTRARALPPARKPPESVEKPPARGGAQRAKPRPRCARARSERRERAAGEPPFHPSENARAQHSTRERRPEAARAGHTRTRGAPHTCMLQLAIKGRPRSPRWVCVNKRKNRKSPPENGEKLTAPSWPSPRPCPPRAASSPTRCRTTRQP